MKRHADGRTIIAIDKVAELARLGLDEHGLKKHELSKAAFAKGKFGTPVLVHRLDRPGDFYWLAPWEVDGKISGSVDLDARFGFLKSARILNHPKKNWLAAATERGLRQRISKLIDGKKFDLAQERGRIEVFPGTYCIPPLLVWKPCRESWSPHLPFWHIAVGGISLYVRIDGKVFTHLTTGRGA